MRMMRKVGVPRDRRIDRRKVALAATAALLMFATAAQAQLTNVVDFKIDQVNSWLGIQNSGFVGTDASGNFNTPFLATTPQNPGLVNGGAIPNGSLVSSIRGDINVAVAPGVAVQFFPGPAPATAGGQQIDQPDVALYRPARDGAGNLINALGPGALGGRNPAVGASINAHTLQYGSPSSNLDPTAPTLANQTALPTDGAGNFSATGVSLGQTSGWQDIISGIASPAEIGLAGDNFPDNLNFTYTSGVTTGGADGHGGNAAFVSGNGNINPVTFHLVLPINFTLWSRVTSSGTLIGYLVSTLNGQIVADPVVPEPSTITLFGFGVVGLLTYAWRARKRKALVA